MKLKVVEELLDLHCYTIERTQSRMHISISYVHITSLYDIMIYDNLSLRVLDIT